MLQFHEFEKMIEEAMETTATSTISTAASKWIARFELNPEVMMEKNITMDDVHFVIKSTYSNQVSCVYSDYNADKLIFRIRLNQLTKPIKKKKMEEEVEDNDDDDDTGVATAKLQSHKDQTNDIFFLRNFQDQLMQNVVIKGVKGIKKVLLRKIQDNLVRQDAEYQNKDIWVLDTVGTNLLEVLSHDYIDQTRTISNDIMEVLRYFGIEAARQCIINELTEVIEFDDTYINDKHIKMLVDRITVSFRPISICRHGINTDNIGPIAKASFEETPEMFLRAAKHADLDTMHGVSANVMCGQEGQYGTNAFQVFMDLPKMLKAGGKGFVKAAASTTTTTAITSVTEEKEQQSNGLESLLSHKVVTKTTPLGYCDDKYDKGF
jgi:DNA-directed RNA polymerase II subunit RPB1